MNEEKAREAGEPYFTGSSVEKVNLNQPVVFVQYASPPNPAQQPPDYLVLSIFTILCCFWPLGLVALIKALEVGSHYRAGKYQEALAASKMAKLLNVIGIGIGAVFTAISILFTVLVVVARAVSPPATANN